MTTTMTTTGGDFVQLRDVSVGYGNAGLFRTSAWVSLKAALLHWWGQMGRESPRC